MTKRVLLLGMYYSKENNPSRGQGYRDRIRCEALENDGYLVETLDNKHDELSAKDGIYLSLSLSLSLFITYLKLSLL